MKSAAALSDHAAHSAATPTPTLAVGSSRRSLRARNVSNLMKALARAVTARPPSDRPLRTAHDAAPLLAADASNGLSRSVDSAGISVAFG